MRSNYFIGVDLGGTKILTALADSSGKILSSEKLPTEPEKGVDYIIDNIVISIHNVIKQADLSPGMIERIGIGSPGPLEIKKGIIKTAPNLKWNNVPIVDILEERLGVDVLLENDANAAALGEKWFGAGKGVDSLLYVTVSTGIGGGIIIDKKIFHGSSDGAGEIGHMVIEPEGPLCGCGNHGCLEALASGTAIGRMGREVVAAGVPTLINEMSDGRRELIDGALVAEAARRDDRAAIEIYEKAGYYLGIGLANLVNILNPEMLVLGGGVMNSADIFMETMLTSLRERALSSYLDKLEIKKAELGNFTGVVGAIAVAMSEELGG